MARERQERKTNESPFAFKRHYYSTFLAGFGGARPITKCEPSVSGLPAG